MERDLFPAHIVNEQHSGLLPHPNRAPDMPRRHRVIGAFEHDVSIAVDTTLGFLENQDYNLVNFRFSK